MRALTLTAATALLLAACGQSRPDTMKSLAEEQSISAQKDSVLLEVSRNATFISDLSQQLGTVRNLKASQTSNTKGDLENNLTPSQRREMILAQVREVTERLNASERRLDESRRRVTELTGTDASKSRRLAAFDSVVTSFRSIIASQRDQIAAMTAQIEALSQENTQLKTENVRLASNTATLTVERDSVIAEQNTVYYVAGTADELAAQHVIEKVGGFLGIGRTVVPARVLDPTAFTPIDMRNVRDITLPNQDRKYRVITRQNLTALATPPDSKGRLLHTVSIREPQSFWAGSKFLILVAQ
jgi:regulator of replication initiation timing